MKPYELLLKENKSWAADMLTADPEFFKKLSDLQTPEYLWIGCSDSRVPAIKLPAHNPEKFLCIVMLPTLL